MATMSYPTLPSTWTAPSSCLASTAYYYVIEQTATNGDLLIEQIFGIPTPAQFIPSGTCVPPSYDPDVPYITDGPCPTGYSVACATGADFQGTPASSVTCCPSGVFNFSCEKNFGCIVDATSGEVWTGSRTDIALSPPTGVPETHTPREGEQLQAWGIRMLSTMPTSSTSTPSLTLPTTSTSGNAESLPTSDVDSDPTATPSPAGLSTGAKAGIGVGVGLAALLFLIAGALLFRRRRQNRISDNTTTAPRELVEHIGPGYKPPAHTAEPYGYGPIHMLHGSPQMERPMQ
ncbi:hypothetical protein F4819DRAFT_312279 [Hypoxylon fuscum]|nr:hypothetical protein F4819DRAFT_312279 [Hypoxylon fuscum]